MRPDKFSLVWSHMYRLVSIRPSITSNKYFPSLKGEKEYQHLEEQLYQRPPVRFLITLIVITSFFNVKVCDLYQNRTTIAFFFLGCHGDLSLPCQDKTDAAERTFA